MNSDRPILRFDLLSILAFAFSMVLGLTPAAAQNEDAQREDAQKDIRERERLPEGSPAQQARPGGRGEGLRAPESLGAGSAAGDMERGARAETSQANLVMRAGAGLTGVRRSSTSIADVDGDGNQDLLITGEDENADQTATLYLGDGQGGFTEANANLPGVRNSSTSIADIDGDGNQDLLITGEDEDRDPLAALYLGDGQGGFTEAGAGLTGVDGSSTSIADVDGDGNQDLLITGGEGAGRNPSATLYLGDGQGGFTEADAGLTDVDDGSTSIADVDGDENPDLLITGFSDPSPAATLYLGDGQGGFTEADAGLTGVSRSSTSIADVDGDGNQDLLITGESVDPSATLYLGDGQGGFTEAGAGLTGVQRGSTSIADIGGDGDLDLLVTGRDALFGFLSEPSARIYVNRQAQSSPNRTPTFTRTFSYDRPLAPGVTLRRFVETGDLDGDSLSITSSAPNVSVNDRGNGTAEVTFEPARDQGRGTASVSVEVTDPDGASQSFSTSIEIPGVVAPFSASLTDVDDGSTSIADVDGDGNQDLLITGVDENGDRTATLYLGDGQGGFNEADAGLTGVDDGSTSIADVDGDGNQDLLITGCCDENFDASATLYLGDGQGGFSEANAGLTGVERGTSTSIADIDGDGNQDLLITGFDGNDPTATLYLGDGQGGFTEAGAGLTGVSSSSTSIADVDGDGNQDLLITGYDGNDPSTTLYLGDGQGGFTEAGAGLPGVDGSTSIADVDGDGNQDLLITGGQFPASATLHLGDGQGGFAEAGAGLPSVDGSTSIADVDGDGDKDLLVSGFPTILYENFFGNPIPVELAGFDARADGDKVRLSWTTASETNNAGFRIQRRGDAETEGRGDWTTIGQKQGAGTTTEAQSYRFTDTDLPYAADALTYRLKQVDTDGSVHFSDPVTVKRAVDEVQLLGTYPNPASQQATVRYALPEKQDVTVRLYDVLGRRVRTVTRGAQTGRHEHALDVSGLASGVYFLRLRAGGETRTQKLTIVR